MPPVLLFLFQCLVLITVPFAIWSVPFVRRRIPLVVVQILFGIALGPTLLARIAPDLSAHLLPGSSLERLSSISWLAVVFFTFLTGLHLEIGDLVGKGRAFFATAVSSMMTPFVCGVGLGVWALGHMPGLMGPNATETSFVLAIGLSVSATALPVLGQILRENDLIRQELGQFAIGCAALNDVLLWIVMTVLLTLIGGSDHRIGTVIALIVCNLLYITFMALLARPLLTKLFDRMKIGGYDLRDSHTVLISSVLLASAFTTEALQLHYLIGAFAAGLVIPKEAKASITARFEPLIVVVLLPFYFIVTGLKVTLDITSSMMFLFIISTLIAMGGKIVGTAVPAIMTGRHWREALHLGALMQCKGFVEAVILTVLLDAGLLANSAFSALMLMALVTTALTMPLARAVGVPGSKAIARPPFAVSPSAE